MTVSCSPGRLARNFRPWLQRESSSLKGNIWDVLIIVVIAVIIVPLGASVTFSLVHHKDIYAAWERVTYIELFASYLLCSACVLVLVVTVMFLRLLLSTVTDIHADLWLFYRSVCAFNPDDVVGEQATPEQEPSVVEGDPKADSYSPVRFVRNIWPWICHEWRVVKWFLWVVVSATVSTLTVVGLIGCVSFSVIHMHDFGSAWQGITLQSFNHAFVCGVLILIAIVLVLVPTIPAVAMCIGGVVGSYGMLRSICDFELESSVGVSDSIEVPMTNDRVDNDRA